MSRFGALLESDLVPDPAPAIQYVAVCQACGYIGRPHPSNLTALRDFDRHAASGSHAAAIAVPDPEPDEDEEVAADR